MKANSKFDKLFKPQALRPATPMDRTAAAAREITDASARARAERTAKLRASRLERQTLDAAPVKKPAAKTKAPKA